MQLRSVQSMGPSNEILQVGEVEVDLGTRKIRRDGESIDVQPRVFDLFQYLIEHRDRVVTTDELLDALWAGHSVVPGVVSTAFYSLRRALGDSAKQSAYIRTVQRVGYQLVANVVPKTTNDGSTSVRTRFPALDLRHAAFVGREAQTALFDDMLADRNPTQLLFVHGLPGIGKTTLLQELVFRCREQGVEHVWLSGATSGPFVDALVAALASSLGCEPSFAAVRDRLGARPLVIFVDDAHLLHGADAWLREELWPALPAHVRLVLAGRRQPSARWRSDPAWPRGAHVVELPYFTEEEARALFSLRGVLAENCDAIWRRARGLPLALTLTLEILERDQQALDVLDDADTMDRLVSWFTDQIDVSAYRRAFEMACLFDEVSVQTLAKLDGPPAADDCLQWLSNLSFAERVGDTIRVHAVVREATIAGLARRDWERFSDLMESAQRFFREELGRTSDAAARVRLLYRFLGQGRHHPALRASYYLPADFGPEATVQVAVPHELPHLLEIVEQHEGRASMEVAQRWLQHPGTQVWCVREEDDVPAGFLLTLQLAMRERHAAIAADPVVAALFDFVDKTPGSRPEDEMIINRTIISRADYLRPSAVLRYIHAAMADTMLWHGTHSPTVAHAFTIYGEPDLWEPVAISAGFVRLRDHEVELGKRTFAPFHRSARGVTPEVWFAEITSRMVGAMQEATHRSAQ